MQYHAETASLLGITGEAPEAFAEYMTRMGRGQGDDTSWEPRDGAIAIRQTTWRLMDEAGQVPGAVFGAWGELWRGASLAHDRRLALEVRQRRDLGDPCFEWRLRRPGPG